MSTRITELVNKIGILFLLVIIVCTPFAINVRFQRPTVSQVFFLEFGVLMLSALYFPLLWLTRTVSLRPTKITLYILLFFVIVLFSSVNSYQPVATLKESLFLLSFVLVYFLFVSLRITYRKIEQFVLALIITGIPIIVYGLLHYKGIDILGYTREFMVGERKIISFLGNPNYLGSYLAPLIFLTFGYGLNRKNTLSGLFFLGLGVVEMFFLVLLGTRGVWLGVFGGFIVLAVFGMRYRILTGVHREIVKRLRIIVIAMVLGTIVFVSFVKLPYKFIETITSSTSIRNRLFWWEISGAMIKDHPLLGIGYRQFDIQVNDYYFEFFEEKPENQLYTYLVKSHKDKRPYHFHNDYIEIAAENGILGLIAFLLIVYGTFFSAITQLSHRMISRNHKVLLACGMAGFISMLVDAFFGFPLYLPCSGVVFWFLVAFVEKMSWIAKPGMKTAE